MTRSTLVIELLCTSPVGQGAEGERKVDQYLTGLCEALGAHAVCVPTAHLSQKYGLAAWLPLEDGGAIHLYVWDDRSPSFISVDILGFSSLDEQRAISFTGKFFGVSKSDDLVYWHTFDRPSTWRNLAPEVYRQRLLLLSPGCPPPPTERVERYLPELSLTLDMKPLSMKMVDQHSAWMHWETSGCVYHWKAETISVDIYTCKAFAPQRALDFTQSFLGLSRLNAFNY
jgi:hypothetical protein